MGRCVLAVITGGMALIVGSAEIAAGGMAEPIGRRTNASIARTAADPWCWKRVYGASCRPLARHTHGKVQKKLDPRPTLIIGIGF
jgi:hypothetical protein